MVHALVVGVDRHADPHIADLRCARADAERIASLLGDLRDARGSVILLTNEQATRERVRHALTESLARRARRDDAVLVFFAGYGAAEIDPATGELSTHLVVHDTELASLRRTSIDLELELLPWLRRLDARSSALLLDASFNGARGGRSLEGPGLRSGPRQRPERFSLRGATFHAGCAALTAADDHEVARELPAAGHGVFTRFLVEAIVAAVDRRDRPTLGGLADDLRARMSSAGVHDQHPIVHGDRTQRLPLSFVERAGASCRPAL